MNSAYPRLSKPRLSQTYGLKLLTSTQTLMQYAPHWMDDIDPDLPRRKSMLPAFDNGSFVKPIKQAFIKNPRLSPSARIMLTLLYGWGGQGLSIKTTTGIIGKHLSRCRRQVFRYLKDAVEEGYLSYSRTKDKMGRYTGIQIFLSHDMIGSTRFGKMVKPLEEKASVHGTLKSETNTKDIYTELKDDDIWRTLSRFAATAGYINQKTPLP